MKERILIIASLGLAAGCARPAASVETTYPTTTETADVQPVAGIDDQEFVNLALSGGMFALESSRYVLKLTTTATADTLAQEMVDDHHVINDDLTRLADKKGWTVPQTMLPKHEGMLDALRQAPSGRVGERYVALQRDSLEDSIILYDRCSKLCLDRDLKMFASTALLMLREHLEEVDGRMPGQ